MGVLLLAGPGKGSLSEWPGPRLAACLGGGVTPSDYFHPPRRRPRSVGGSRLLWRKQSPDPVFLARISGPNRCHMCRRAVAGAPGEQRGAGPAVWSVLVFGADSVSHVGKRQLGGSHTGPVGGPDPRPALSLWPRPGVELRSQGTRCPALGAWLSLSESAAGSSLSEACLTGGLLGTGSVLIPENAARE